mmetsp:Transcript_15884/g.18265  ORF Transcript_15884/g.18265 Transcript_15884/m.18265 type:complete len:227 (+) Transcript_15884:2107-2787(+)
MDDPIGHTRFGAGFDHEPIVHTRITRCVLGVGMELISVVRKPSFVNVTVQDCFGGTVRECRCQFPGEMTRDRQCPILGRDTRRFIEAVSFPHEQIFGFPGDSINLDDSHFILSPRTPGVFFGTLCGGVRNQILGYGHAVRTAWIGPRIRTREGEFTLGRHTFGCGRVNGRFYESGGVDVARGVCSAHSVHSCGCGSAVRGPIEGWDRAGFVGHGGGCLCGGARRRE